MKLKLLAFTSLSALSSQAQVSNVEVSVTQPTCSTPTGMIEVTSPVNNISVSPVLSNLFISEVTDQTTGALSYIEIYNGTGNAVNLANYKLLVFSNGNSAPTCNLTLSGSIGNGMVKVISMGSATNQGGVTPDMTFAACGGVNNNDAIALATTSNVIIDLWGRTDGVAFTPAAAGYVYRRKAQSVHPKTSWDANDWTASAPEDYTNIGAYLQGTYYTYSLDNGPGQASTIFSGVASGSHSIVASELPTGAVSLPTMVTVSTAPAMPSAYFTYPNASICSSSTEQYPVFDVGTTQGGVFTVSPDGLVLNPTTGAIDPSASIPGNYILTYTVANACGSTATASTVVRIMAAQSANFVYVPSNICTSSAMQIPTLESGFTQGGTFTATPSGLMINPYTGAIDPSASVPGVYMVGYVLSANMGCPGVNTVTVVQILASPSASITSDSASINSGSAMQLGINTTGAIGSVQWTPATALSSTTIPNPIAYPGNTTTYTAQITYANGCEATTSFTVNVNPLAVMGAVSITTADDSIGLFDTINLNVQLSNVADLYSLYMSLKSNAAVNQYLDYEGYTLGTVLGTGSVINAPLPTVSASSIDFGITKVGAVAGTNGGGLFYSLRFKPKNIAIPNGTSFCFYLDDVDAHNASGNAFGLGNQGQVCVTYNSQVDVWPGDLDKDNSVTTADLLPIGYFYNHTGPSRANASINFTAQPATLWGVNHSVSNDDGYKVFADANGDGVVNSTDQLAINANMSQSHSKMASVPITPPNVVNGNSVGGVIVTPSTTTIEGAGVPQLITFTVDVQNSVGLDALYGINTNLLFDPDFFDLSTATVDYTGSIFGSLNSDCLVQKFASESYLSVALTRYANAPINGEGLLYKVTLFTKPIAQGVGYNTTVFGYSDAANDQTGTPLPIGDASPINISISNLGVPTNALNDFAFYPNPVKDKLTIRSGSVINLVSVYNVIGQLVWTQNQNSNEVTVDLSGLPTNTYFVRAVSELSQQTFKIIKE